MDNNQLQRRIEVLEKWQKEKQSQQISFPLDNKSIEILQRYFMRIISTITWTAGVGGNTFLEYLGQQNNILFSVSPPDKVNYTVNISTNYLTTNQISGNLKFFDGQEVLLYSDGIAPTPLSAGLGTSYFVRDSDGYTFKLAATLGGAAIDITDTGSGRQFIEYT